MSSVGSGACVSQGNPCLPESECNHCNETADSCRDPTGTSCTDDGLYCTGAEACNGSGACVPQGNPCLPESECKHCNEAADACRDPTGTSCTDYGLVCDSGACLGRLSINEFKPHPESDNAGFEWVDLYNPGSEGVRLDGWWIEWHKADPSAPSGAAFLADDLVVPPQDVVLLGGEHVDGTDGEVDLAMG